MIGGSLALHIIFLRQSFRTKRVPKLTSSRAPPLLTLWRSGALDVFVTQALAIKFLNCSFNLNRYFKMHSILLYKELPAIVP